MMKLDSCKKKQLYECSFIKFTLKNIQKPITWVWQGKYRNPWQTNMKWIIFMNDDIEKEKWTLQREEEKHLNPPVKVGTGLFFVSQLSAPFRCMLRAIGSVVNYISPSRPDMRLPQDDQTNQLKDEEPPVTPENRSQVVLIKDIKCIPVKLFANYTNIFWYLKLNSACYKHEDLNFWIKFVDLLVPSRSNVVMWIAE